MADFYMDIAEEETHTSKIPKTFFHDRYIFKDTGTGKGWITGPIKRLRNRRL